MLEKQSVPELQTVNGTSPKPDNYQIRLIWSEEHKIWYALIWSSLDNKQFEIGGPNFGKLTHAMRQMLLEHEVSMRAEEEPLIVPASNGDI